MNALNNPDFLKLVEIGLRDYRYIAAHVLPYLIDNIAESEYEVCDSLCCTVSVG